MYSTLLLTPSLSHRKFVRSFVYSFRIPSLQTATKSHVEALSDAMCVRVSQAFIFVTPTTNLAAIATTKNWKFVYSVKRIGQIDRRETIRRKLTILHCALALDWKKFFFFFSLNLFSPFKVVRDLEMKSQEENWFCALLSNSFHGWTKCYVLRCFLKSLSG